MANDAIETQAEAVRDVHRQLVRELGVMDNSFAGTSYSFVACHALWEIGKIGPIDTSRLSELLVLDEASVQQTVTTLLDAGEICENDAGEHSSKANLSLSTQGRQTLSTLNGKAQEMAVGALSSLSNQEIQFVLSGLQLYTNSLRARRGNFPGFKPVSAKVHCGWQPGLIGRAVEMHASYYSQAVGFGAFFEASLASGLGDLVLRFGTECNNAWSAMVDGVIVGTVFIDGEDLGVGRAHLRAFIVDGKVRGGGIGRMLLTQALNFVDMHNFGETHLWTFKGLDAARRLYESFGFVLEEESIGSQWGKDMTEQRFIRRRGAGVSVSG